MLVLECVPAVLAGRDNRALDIPVIGIGAGADTDGQVLVLYDMLGITMEGHAEFVHNFLAGRTAYRRHLRPMCRRSGPAPSGNQGTRSR